MKLRNVKKLDKFIRKHRNSKEIIENWKIFVEQSDWDSFDDIKDCFNVRFINESRLVFKIGGIKWRIDTKIDYPNKQLFIKRVGTHEEYNKWKYED